MNRKKLVIELAAYSIVSYFILVLPYTRSLNSNTVFSLMFMGLDEFDKLNLNRFSLPHILFFMIFLQITFHQMILITLENKSFSSTYQNKIGRHQYVVTTRNQCIRIILVIFLGLLIGILLIVSMIFISGNTHSLPIINVMKVIIYFMKICLIIFIMLYSYSILSVWKSADYFIITVYSIWISLIMMDILFNTKTISLSSTLQIEVFYLAITILIVVSISVRIEKKYSKIKEIYG